MVCSQLINHQVQLYDFSVPVSFGGLETKMATLEVSDTFLRSIVRSSNNDSLLLLFMGDFTTAVIHHNNLETCNG